MKYFVNRARPLVHFMASLLVIGVVINVPHALANDAELKQKVQLLENQLRAIQDKLSQGVVFEAGDDEDCCDGIEEIEEKATIAKEKAVLLTRRLDRKSRMLFFRGGFGHMMNLRNGASIQSNVAPVGAQDQADKDAWYFGAGFDWSLTENAWGIMPKTDVFAELMFEYKEFGPKVQGNALANAPTQLAGGALNPRSVTVSQLTVSAAPKIKFMQGSKVRPWIIPAGFAIHVISPPSESVTYLAPGVMFGAGVDYNIWRDFYVGVDARYHVTGGKKDGVNIDGLTAGGYLGIGF